MRTKAQPAWALAPLFLLPLCLAWPAFLGKAWIAGDLLRQFHPWKELGRQAAFRGELPLWNPFAYCGMPLFANFQSGLAYPFHLPFYLLPFHQALALHLAFHFLLGGLGFFALLRALKAGWAAALLAGLCWQANAFVLCRLEFLSALSALSWGPWILWALASQTALWRLASVVAVQALSGYPPELAFSALSALALCPFIAKGSFKRLALGYSLGLAAAAVLLLPGLELMFFSSRLAQAPDSESAGALAAADFLRWLDPRGPGPWTSAFSLGVPATLLIFFGRGKPARWAWLLLCLGALLGSGLGSQFLPNRHPSLALSLCATAAAVLCGLGWEKLKPAQPAWLAAAAALFAGMGIISLNSRFKALDASAYSASESARFLAKRNPDTRILASPALQTERESEGGSLEAAWSLFPNWLQANTPALASVKDANGYDPLAPAPVVKLLNDACFPEFAKDDAALDLLGVGTLADWDPKEGRFHVALRKRASQPLRAALLSLGKAPLRLQLKEEGNQSLAILLPEGHPAGRVALSDTWYPGWQAEIDGSPAPIQKFMQAFRAVEVEAGSREIRMRYRPLSLRLGFGISLAAWACILALMARRRRARMWS